MPRASSPSRALVLLVAVAVGQGPTLAYAAPATPAKPPEGAGTATTTTPSRLPAGQAADKGAGKPGSTAPGTAPLDPGPDPPPAPISPEAAATGKQIQSGATSADQTTLVAPANNVSPTTSAGVGGRLVDAEDPEAKRAEADLEGTALTTDKAALADLPSRLPPLQRGAWWSMFGAFALASAGGVFAGLAEVQEDKATRLAITLDGKTGSQLRYADVQKEYEDTLRIGKRDAAAARGLLAVGAGFLVAGVVLFVVHAVRARKAGPKTGERPAPQPPPRLGAALGGLEVRF